MIVKTSRWRTRNRFLFAGSTVAAALAVAIAGAGERAMVSTWLAARIRNKLTRLRGICARAIAGLLDDGQGAEISPDQWLEILLPVIADNVRAIGREAGPCAERRARPPTAAA